jgi:hypothetical protein
MDKRLIQDLKNSWRNCNSTTSDFAQSVPSEKWQIKPFAPRFKSFAWEFACLVRTRLCYLKALKMGKMDFSDDQEDIPNKEVIENYTKKQVQDLISQTTNDFITQIEKINSTEKVRLINWVLQHERIHHGKLMLYCSYLDIELPKSFKKTWEETNF